MADERSCDQHCELLRRREFLSAAALSALVLLEAACGNGQIGPSDAVTGVTSGVTAGGSTTTANGLVVKLASYPALASVGGAARVDNGSGRAVALVRTGAASFLALSLRCPHEGYTVSVQSGAFYCPAHGARFSSNGTWTGGQRTGNMTSLANTYDAVAGTVTIAV